MLKPVNTKEELQALKERFLRLREAKDVINDGRVTLGIDQKSGEPADLLAKQKLQEAVTKPLSVKLDSVAQAVKDLQTGVPASAKATQSTALTPDAAEQARLEQLSELNMMYREALGDVLAVWETRQQVSLEELDQRAGEAFQRAQAIATDISSLGGLPDPRVTADLGAAYGSFERYIRKVSEAKAQEPETPPPRRPPAPAAEEPPAPPARPGSKPPGKPLQGVKVKKPGAQGKGLKNHVFRLSGDGSFGAVQVSLPDLAAMKLKAHKGGKLVMNKRVDPDFVDLVTKRYNPKRQYSPLAVDLFRQLVRHSDLPMDREHTGKMKLLYPGARGKGVPEPVSVPEAVARLTVLTGERDAGNNSAVLKNELAGLIDFLVRQKKLSKKDAMALYSDYVQ